ncbi:unnamed protein product [Effrenium voratum]|nr:unnamed protein product [Effrenium voratum]
MDKIRPRTSRTTAFVLFTLWLNRWMAAISRRYSATGEGADSRPPSGMPESVNLLGVYGGVVATVFVSIAMAQSTQLSLPVPQRNSMLAAVAFLTPVKDIFQFLEDTTTVKITFAMGAGDLSSIRHIVLVGLVGGLGAGILGALLMTALQGLEVIEVLLAPGSAQAQLENPGCALLPSATEVVDTARGLWLLTSWSWPLQFCSMVLTGLLMGAREFALYGVASILAQAALGGLWFSGPKPQNLHLLGWAGFVSNAVFCGSLALFIAVHRPLRQKYGLLLEARTVEANGAREALSAEAEASGGTKGVLLDGLLAMTLDLALQAAGTISVFVAAYVSLQDMYQLSAAGAALPQFTAYAAGLGYVVRLAGGALVGRQAHEEFAFLMKVMIGLSESCWASSPLSASFLTSIA